MALPVNTKSSKTTLAGIVTLVGALCTLVLGPFLDTDPATVPQWGLFGTAAATAVGLFLARDHSVTSEQAGLHGPPQWATAPLRIVPVPAVGQPATPTTPPSSGSK